MGIFNYREKLALINRLPTVPLVALTVYGEGRGEPREGKIQIAHVALLRERNTLQWDDIRDPKQFSCFNMPANENDERNFLALTEIKLLDPLFIECLSIAEEAEAGRLPATFPTATHYHVKKMGKYPAWAAKFELLGQIGNHLFYSDKTATRTA